MFQQTFKAQLASLTDNEILMEELWQEISDGYSEAGRYYHTLVHLDHLCSELTTVKEYINDWKIIILSVAYHDLVYDVLRSDNEERSAEVAMIRLSRLPLTDSEKERCKSQILATKEHGISENADANFLLDADLSVLGCGQSQYDQYAEWIRKEYAAYPDAVYKPGRAKVLEHFLQLPQLYKTPIFRDKYETRARANLRRELELLNRDAAA